MTELKIYSYQLEEIEKLRPTEQVDKNAVLHLAEKITKQGVWTTALPIEAENGYVMDGNHRLQAALLLNLKRVPVIRLCYSDARVSLNRWTDGLPFCSTELLCLLKSNELLPYKTTKHAFTPELPKITIDLQSLR